jgi:hypothetical protein
MIIIIIIIIIIMNSLWAPIFEQFDENEIFHNRLDSFSYISPVVQYNAAQRSTVCKYCEKNQRFFPFGVFVI